MASKNIVNLTHFKLTIYDEFISSKINLLTPNYP